MSLIYSTNAMQWFKNKDIVARNISDLSSKKCQIFIYFMTIPETDWAWLNKMLNISATRKFYEWERRFLASGLQVLEKKMFEHVEFVDDDYYNEGIDCVNCSYNLV
jgi:hypothetical protein